MAYSGEVPWHGLGKRVREDLTAEEMLIESGCNWTVSKRPLFMEDGQQVDMTALVRDSDNHILTYVPDDWNSLQNADAFEFFKEFVDAGEMEMHTAGSLWNGQRVWALAKINDRFRLRFGKKEDVIENFLLFSNPHKYGCTITVDMTSVRVVCNNTLTLALSKASANIVRISHKNAFDPEVVKKTLFQANKEFKEYEERAKFLASKKADPTKIEYYFRDVFPTFSKKEGKEDSLSRNAKSALEVLHTQPGAELGAGTWWQPFNAVTYMMDHHLGRSQENRIGNVWFGTMKDKKVTAMNKALEYAEAA